MTTTPNIERFLSSLQEQHYSVAFIGHLVDTITSNTRIIDHNADITTLQEIYELIQK